MFVLSISSRRAKNLSAAELRRLSMAEELVHGPAILFADEPITGCNSKEESMIMSCLRELVNQGRTVVTTMHQVCSNLLSLCYDSFTTL